MLMLISALEQADFECAEQPPSLCEREIIRKRYKLSIGTSLFYVLTGNGPSCGKREMSILLTETVAIFSGDEEGLHHLRLLKVAAKVVQLVKPELVTVFIRIAA